MTPAPAAGAAPAPAPRPYTLVAELTYRCPLACFYCSNPLDFADHRPELDTETWKRVLSEAEALGVVQLNLSGGEPLLRNDLTELVAHAERLQLYTNLITSGLPLTRERLTELRDAGLDNVQLSLQDTDAAAAERVSGKDVLRQKLEVARWVKELGLPLTINIVLHRDNLSRVGELITLAERLAADRLELANTQYLAWALRNRDALLPSREQLDAARAIAAEARQRLAGKMELLFVTPDYHANQPKACMDGWARRFVLISPTGLVLPCHAAHTLPGLEWWSVRERGLEEIWRTSPGLRRFRGHGWMREPCRSCERREKDFGGCRCQAFALTGDAAAADPVCSRSPEHGRVLAARQAASASVSTPGEHRRRLRVMTA